MTCHGEVKNEDGTTKALRHQVIYSHKNAQKAQKFHHEGHEKTRRFLDADYADYY
jgi:hypothetical protein